MHPAALAARSAIRTSLFELHWFATLIKGGVLSVFSSAAVDREELFRMLWLFRRVRKHTWVGVPRLRVLYTLANALRRMPSIEGDIVECGVFNGGSAAVMAYAGVRLSSVRRDMWLFDSFDGLPEPGERDHADAWRWVGECRGDPQKVERLFDDLGVPRSRIHLVPGWFKDTVPSAADRIRRVSLLHVDADWYESTKLCLESFYARISPGGFVVIDDYGYWSGCRRAVDEFVARHAPGVNLIRVGVIGCYFQKT